MIPPRNNDMITVRADSLRPGDILPIGGPQAREILNADHDIVESIEEDGPRRVIVAFRGPLGRRIYLLDDPVTREVRADERQRIPSLVHGIPVIPPPSRDAIADAFAATRSAVQQLEQERDLIAVCPSWSVAQHVRRAS